MTGNGIMKPDEGQSIDPHFTYQLSYLNTGDFEPKILWLL